jgi:hypothetical protein
LFPPFHSAEKEEVAMGNANPILGIRDKGGRRLGAVRRIFLTLGYRHERRSRQERRSRRDRRTGTDQGNFSYWRRSMDKYLEFLNAHKGLAYGLLLSLPIWAAIILFIVLKLWF